MNDQLKLTICQAARTKALLHDLPLDSRFDISVSIMDCDANDRPKATVTYNPAMLDKIGGMKKPPPVPTPTAGK